MFREINQMAYRTPDLDPTSKQTKRLRKMLEECQKVITQLQSELQYALQQNQQKDQIITLLTEQKDFYEQQSRKSDQKNYQKLTDQLNFNNSLANGLKQYNKELTEKNTILQQENKDLWKKCQYKEQILKITEQNITKLQEEKSLLQREWAQTLKSVKRKIFQIQQENEKLYFEKQINKKRIPHQSRQKENQQQKRKLSINLTQSKSGNSKVEEILRQIDQKLMNCSFLDKIQTTKQVKKEIKNFDFSEANKENISENIYSKLPIKTNEQAKKVPILKLSELTLQGMSC